MRIINSLMMIVSTVFMVYLVNFETNPSPILMYVIIGIMGGSYISDRLLVKANIPMLPSSWTVYRVNGKVSIRRRADYAKIATLEKEFGIGQVEEITEPIDSPKQGGICKTRGCGTAAMPWDYFCDPCRRSCAHRQSVEEHTRKANHKAPLPKLPKYEIMNDLVRDYTLRTNQPFSQAFLSPMKYVGACRQCDEAGFVSGTCSKCKADNLKVKI